LLAKKWTEEKMEVQSHQSFDIFVVVLYNTKKHMQQPQHPAKSQKTATPTIFGQILTTPDQLRPITPAPMVISAALNFP
jgi:hypothetical protein